MTEQGYSYDDSSPFTIGDIRGLFACIIEQAVSDARNTSKKPARIRDKEAALLWIFAGCAECENSPQERALLEDFEEICCLADTKPEAVRRRLWHLHPAPSLSRPGCERPDTDAQKPAHYRLPDPAAMPGALPLPAPLPEQLSFLP